MRGLTQEFNSLLEQQERLWGLCPQQARGEFPRDFKVPLDQEITSSCSLPVPIGGFGGDPYKLRAEHRAKVQSVGKAPIILIHGNAGSADVGRWAMFDMRAKLIADAGYPRELIWAPSYLGNTISSGGILDLTGFPHTRNVGEIRKFIDNVCEYLDVEVVDIVAHSLGCTLAYSVFRGLGKETEEAGTTSWTWDEPKKWHRVGTFVALAGAFHGLKDYKGEWTPGGEFVKGLLAEEPVSGKKDETPYQGGEPKTPGPLPHNITYFCGIAKGDFADSQTPTDAPVSTSMLDGAISKVYNYDYTDDILERHERIIKDPVVVRDIKGLLNSVPPVPSVTVSIDKDSGDYEGPLTITIGIDPPDKAVSYEANRVTKEVLHGHLVEKISETLKGTFVGGQRTLTLSTDGMWKVRCNVEGAIEAEERIYWVGTTEMIEAAIDKDISTTFEGTLEVKATTTRGRLYHSLSGGGPREVALSPGDALSAVVHGEGWSEGDVVRIDRNAVVYFVAINDEGVASEIVSASFERA